MNFDQILAKANNAISISQDLLNSKYNIRNVDSEPESNKVEKLLSEAEKDFDEVWNHRCDVERGKVKVPNTDSECLSTPKSSTNSLKKVDENTLSSLKKLASKSPEKISPLKPCLPPRNQKLSPERVIRTDTHRKQLLEQGIELNETLLDTGEIFSGATEIMLNNVENQSRKLLQNFGNRRFKKAISPTTSRSSTPQKPTIKRNESPVRKLRNSPPKERNWVSSSIRWPSKHEEKPKIYLRHSLKVNVTKWDELPGYIWSLIVQLLNVVDVLKLATVSRLFYRISHDSSINIHVQDPFEKVCYKRRKQVRSIILTKQVTNEIIDDFSSFGNMKSFTHRGNALTFPYNRLSKIPLERITSLDLSWSNLKDSHLAIMSPESMPLTKLVLTGNSEITNLSLFCCPQSKLKTLSIRGLHKFKSLETIPLAVENLDLSRCSSLDNFTYLQRFKLKSLLVSNLVQFTQLDLHTVLITQTNLESLSIANNPQVVDSWLVEIISYKSGLRKLDLSGCEKLTPFMLTKLVAVAVELENFDISYLHINSNLITALQNLTNLRSINVNFCNSIDLSPSLIKSLLVSYNPNILFL